MGTVAAPAIAEARQGFASDAAKEPSLPMPRLQAGSRLGAVAAAVAIEAAMIGALVEGLLPHGAAHEIPAVQAVVLAAPDHARPEPERPRPDLSIKHPVVPTVVLPAITLPPTTAPAPPVTPPTPPARAAATTPESVDPILTFQGQLTAAVQAEVDKHYPPAARMLHQQGQVAVSFQYVDGTVSNIAVAQSSGFPLLDGAAVATVHDARYPNPPVTLMHRTLELIIVVRFRLAARNQ